MRDIDREFLKKLAGWSADGAPVSSLYLDVDGRRHPRLQDCVGRAEQLCHDLMRQARASDLSRDAYRSVVRDTTKMMAFLRDLERGPVRGVALFSASRAGLWQDVVVPRPVQDRATVAEHPYVLPLEALVETYEAFCTCLVDREKARIFLARMGRIEEERDIQDEVPGRHEQGGWSQARFQRHIEEHVAGHLKRVADQLLRLFERRKFDHLILAGPEELIPEFERGLHDYLQRRVAARTTLPMTATVDQVLGKSLAVEEAVEAERERRLVEQVRAEAAAGRHAVTGLGSVLEALNQGRVRTLLVPFAPARPGLACSRCGRLALQGRSCATCGGRLDRVGDVVERAVESALGQGSRVEALAMAGRNGESWTEIGALLRY